MYRQRYKTLGVVLNPTSCNTATASVEPQLISITVIGSTDVDERDTSQYTCLATYSDGSTNFVQPNWGVQSTPRLISIDIVGSDRIFDDSSTQYTSTGVYSDGSVHSITTDTWSITDTDLPDDGGSSGGSV